MPDFNAAKASSTSFNILNNLPDYIPEKDIKSVFDKIRAGDVEERNRFMRSNLKLIRKECEKYLGQGADIEQLFSTGIMGLAHAIEKYDPEKAAFSTYATPWINDYIRQDLMKSRHSVHVPIHVTKASKKCQKSYYELRRKLDREPTHNEISELVGIEVGAVAKLLMLESIERSADEAIGGENEDLMLLDTLTNEDSLSLNVENTNMQDKVQEILSKLPSREVQVLVGRFGLFNSTEKSLAEIGASLDLSRERIRQIEKSALKNVQAILKKEGIDGSILFS